MISSRPLTRLKQWFLQPDRLAIFGLLGLLFAFYPDLFLVKAAPLTGDHLEQHYPWAYLLAQSVKEFKLPFWTPFIHCGFPLVAESQVGAFYIPNLLMYFVLPFHVAYSYMNLIHWFIAGWGTYLYAKHIKLGAMPSFVAAVIFVFGSAYGGAYYNMTSLKTISWFPVALFFLEQYLADRRWRYLVLIAGVIGQSFVAGYLQMAVLTWFMFGIYAMLRIFAFPENSIPWTKKSLAFGALTVTALFALFLALPQIYLTFQMAMMSNRTGLEEGYAYLGSMSPVALATLISPNLSLICRGNNLYAGSFSLFLILFAFYSPDTRKSRTFMLWSVITLLALLLALGQWSPLYVALIKLTKFYSFRVPAKFLGFICFGLAMLSAAGFQALWQGRSTQVMVKKSFRAYLAILAVFGIFVASANLFLTVGRNFALKLGEYFVRQFIYAKPGHPHPLEHYLSVVKSYPDNTLKYLSLSDPANMGLIAVIISCMVLLCFFLRVKKVTRYLLSVAIIFLMVDLYAASFLDIKQDLAQYKTALLPSPVLEILSQEKIAGRLARIYGFRAPTQRLPLVPSKNMIYGIEDIGVYSPLVSQRYYQTIGLFGNINDSTLAFTPTPAFVRLHLPLLSFMDVSHVLSATPLSHPELKLLYTDPEKKVFLYRNERNHANAYFIRDVRLCNEWNDLKRDLLANDFDPARQLLIEKAERTKYEPKIPRTEVVPAPSDAQASWTSRSGTLKTWDLISTTNGFFVIPRTFYPGWKAKLDGREVPVLKAYGMFLAIFVPEPGRHSISFEFHPFSREVHP